MRRVWILLLLMGCAQPVPLEVETDNRTGRLADVGLIAFYCSDPRNAGYEQYVQDHHTGLGNATNIKIYPIRFPGSFGRQLAHGTDVERSMILEGGARPLLNKAKHEAARVVISFAYHDNCAVYGDRVTQQVADARAAKDTIEKHFGLKAILEHEKMSDHLVDIEIVEQPGTTPIHAASSTPTHHP